jgi:hypothetical protein
MLGKLVLLALKPLWQPFLCVCVCVCVCVRVFQDWVSRTGFEPGFS